MQTLTESILRLAPPGGLFDDTVVRNLFPDTTDGARKQLVHRATVAGEVLRLKSGLFILEGQFSKTGRPHPFVVASALHAPSHISMETALSYHGLIPEAVQQIASATSVRSRSYDTPLGVFTFTRVLSSLPRAGVECLKIEPNAWAFVASPLRAIADMVYLNKNVNWAGDGVDYLTESLRIEEDDLAELSFDGADEICSSIKDNRTCDYISKLKGCLSDDR